MPQNPLQNLAVDVLKRLGMPKEPNPVRAPQGESIDVPGKYTFSQDFPKNIDEIILGTQTSRPTGSYISSDYGTNRVIPRSTTVPSLASEAQDRFGIVRKPISNDQLTLANSAFRQLKSLYPYSTRLNSDIGADPRLSGLTMEGAFNLKSKGISLQPEAIDAGTLAHELTHSAADRNTMGRIPWRDPITHMQEEMKSAAVEEIVRKRLGLPPVAPSVSDEYLASLRSMLPK